jgi:hypothetical protein
MKAIWRWADSKSLLGSKRGAGANWWRFQSMASVWLSTTLATIKRRPP